MNSTTNPAVRKPRPDRGRSPFERAFGFYGDFRTLSAALKLTRKEQVAAWRYLAFCRMENMLAAGPPSPAFDPIYLGC